MFDKYYVTIDEYRTSIEDLTDLQANTMKLMLGIATVKVDNRIGAGLLLETGVEKTFLGKGESKLFLPKRIESLTSITIDDVTFDITYPGFGIISDYVIGMDDGSNQRAADYTPLYGDSFENFAYGRRGLPDWNLGNKLPAAIFGKNSTIKVTGNWGYTVIPDMVKLAVVRLAQMLFNDNLDKEIIYSSFESQSLGGYNYKIRPQSQALNTTGNDEVDKMLIPFLRPKKFKVAVI